MLPNQLCTHFLTWQCRVRQIAMRENEGRPSSGMCARVTGDDRSEISPAMVTLMTRENPFESTEFFKFQVQKHNDPQDVYTKSLTFLQSTHYHRAIEFSDELTALFQPGSKLAQSMLAQDSCMLEFSEYTQSYALPCKARKLHATEPAYQATLWHNRIFNPMLGDDVIIIGFKPDWDMASEMLAASKNSNTG